VGGIGLASKPCFSRGHVRQNLGGKEIVDMRGILECIPPEREGSFGMGQETSHHVEESPIATLSNAVLLWRIAIGELLLDAKVGAVGVESVVEELATTVRADGCDGPFEAIGDLIGPANEGGSGLLFGGKEEGCTIAGVVVHNGEKVGLVALSHGFDGSHQVQVDKVKWGSCSGGMGRMGGCSEFALNARGTGMGSFKGGWREGLGQAREELLVC
jgi:hypothetical protein